MSSYHWDKKLQAQSSQGPVGHLVTAGRICRELPGPPGPLHWEGSEFLWAGRGGGVDQEK
jgi:hypothetical protein